ncbi:endonuclease/exonuclease/phosphatase family protein [Mycobacterium sp. B14F4]|uniref:endonuclease/exonuclease/phosphatase family protein n=1 Tax=Mycobacterium sp. B14F4 TaxID=3153565 RepID=UPI00325D642A
MRPVLDRIHRWLTPRQRRVAVTAFASGRWNRAETYAGTDRTELTFTTFNVWNDGYFADERYDAIVELLTRQEPDIMVFQEVTRRAHDILLSHPLVREQYFCAAVIGGGVGDYGMAMLSRVPLREVTYTRLPSRMFRGFLQAELTAAGVRTAVSSVHLDSGKASAGLRARQLDDVFGALRSADDAIVLGDFNMRDAENSGIAAPFTDVWPMLRPREPGFTEDTAINLMRLDSRDKHRQVRFDRVLVKGSAWTPADIDLIGTQPISTAHPRVFPSDHFGLRCRLVRTGRACR